MTSDSAAQSVQQRRPRVALLSPISDAVGEARAVPRLAAAISAQGFHVDLLQGWKEWDSFAPHPFPEGVRVVSLHTRRFVPFIPSFRRVSSWASYRLWASMVGLGMVPGLVSYLRKVEPDFLAVRMLTTPAIIAHRMAGSQTKLVLSMGGLPRRAPLRNFLWPRLYRSADGYVAPAKGVAEAAALLSGIPAERFRIIPNPVLDEAVLRLAEEPLDHLWFGKPDCPVILGVGRLTRQKEFSTLIRAFAHLRREMPARLVILGEGELRRSLEALVRDLGVSADVQMSGFERNPYRFMRAADVFVMSSAWEGPGHVLIEAQAIGTPAISTDCPAGPRDTLLDGKAGILVPVGDHEEMARAVARMLNDKAAAGRMASAGREASARFFDASVGKKWATFLHELESERAGRQ